MSSGQLARSRQSQTIISLLAECSRTARSSIVCSSSPLPVFDENLWDLCDEPRVVRYHHLPGASRPGIAQRSAAKLVKHDALWPTGSFGRISVRRDSSSEIKRSRVRSGRVSLIPEPFRKVVSRQNKLEGERGMQFLILRGGVLDFFHDRLQLRFRVFKFVMELDDLVECCGLLFRLTGLIEKCEELVCARDGLGPQCDRLRFLWPGPKSNHWPSLLFSRSSTTVSIPFR